MKILRLDLRAFGPFKDVALDLAAGSHGLHVIYGGNEAGKSSALRGLRQLFFGIDERTPDAFRHPYAQLRIGATLRQSDGSQLTFLRRKGNKNVIRAANDVDIVDPNEVQRYLGGVDEKTFRTMFGIDRAALEAGGREIIQGSGHLGQMLFAAGAGIASLREVQRGLDEELDSLFQPRAKTKRINQALAEWHDAQETIKKVGLSQDEWARHDRALTEARRERDALSRERAEVSRNLHRLTRIRDALPAVARWRELRRAIDEFGQTPALAAEFGKRREQALLDLRLAEADACQAKASVCAIDERIGQMRIPEAILACAEQIKNAAGRFVAHRKAMSDRARLLGYCQGQEHEARTILKNLGRDPDDFKPAESLRPVLAELGRLRDLALAEKEIKAHRSNASEALAKCQGQRARAEQDLARCPPAVNPAPLTQTLARVVRDGDLEDRLASERDALTRAERQLQVDLGKLRPWPGDLSEVENLPVPSVETVDRFERDLAEIEAEANRQHERVKSEHQSLRDLERQIDALQRQCEVPAESDLKQARARRDTGWSLVRRAWLEKQEPGEDEQQFITVLPPSNNLAEAYEKSVTAADVISDRLRREAERIAALGKHRADQKFHECQRDDLIDRVATTQNQIADIQQAWSALWKPVGIEPLSPREMRGWLARQHDLVEGVRTWIAQGEQVRRLTAAIDEHRRALTAALNAVGQLPSSEPATRAELIGLAQHIESTLIQAAHERADLEKAIAHLETEMRQAQTAFDAAERAWGEWRTDWMRIMDRVQLPPELTPAEALTFADAVAALFQKLHEVNGNRSRISGIDRDAKQFQEDVASLAKQIAPDLLALDPERAIQELDVRLQLALESAGKRTELVNQRAREAERLEDIRRRLSEASARVELLCQEAGCTSAEEFPAVEERSKRQQELRKELEQTETHLRALSAGATVADFADDAANVDADAIDLEIERLGQHDRDLGGAIQKLDESIGAEQTVLASMSGSAEAAEAADLAEHLRAQLQGDVEQYIRLQLAAAVLRRGIDRYREKHQEPVLRRASELFRKLTAGSFERLQMDCRDDGEPVLKGVRGGAGELVGVEGMSDGSGDQLYLALRLASLETWLRKNEPIPFIVDDLLLNFDNARAASALRVLGELSHHTQVLFFTHHEHLVELARDHVAGEALVVHRLNKTV